MHRHNRFTLIEMLVVIAIISILTALLMPALHSAIACGRSITCMNNLRQIGVMALNYADDWHGILPHNGTTSTTGTMASQYYFELSKTLWGQKLPYYGHGQNIWRCSYATIYLCPQAESSMPGNATLPGHWTLSSTYSINTAMGGGRAKSTIPRPTTRNLSTKVTWFGDAYAKYGTNPSTHTNPGYYFEPRYYNLGWAKPWMWVSPEIEGHPSQSANFIYGDMHADSIPYLH